MNKTSGFFVLNLWWLIPLAVTILFWQHAAPILLMLIFAYIGRIILNPAVKKTEKFTGSRKWSVFSIIVILLFLFIILSSSLFPIIKEQVTSFQTNFSIETLNKLQTKLTIILESFLPTFLFDIFNDTMIKLDSSMSDIWSSGLTHIQSFIGGAGSIAFALGSAMLSFLILIVFMIFFLLDGEKFSYVFLHAVPEKNQELAKRMLDKTSNQIKAYIRGQLIAGSSVAITSIIGLYILQTIAGINIPYTILIGLAAGLCNLIPFIGPVMGMLPAIIIYLVTDQTIPIHILYVLLIITVFAIVQLIDNLIMSPYIMGGSVGLHPMFVIVLVLFGASVAGILGMLFVIPIAAILKVIIEELVTTFKKHNPI